MIGILSWGAISNVYAHDYEENEQLQQEIQELNARIAKLESLFSNIDSPQELSVTNEGWKTAGNWRKLATGMSPGKVRMILGEPQRIDGGTVAHWYYEHGGQVTFINDGVTGWREPRR